MTNLQRIATQVVEKLVEKGFIAYFAGGFVRDLLLQHHSSDIDIATDALPEEIASIFPEHVLVGAQFGVCIVRYKGHQFEIATFRQDVSYEDGRRPAKVLLRSTPEEDAKRRDFTINGMFFDPLSEKILDFVEGQKDLQEKRIRTIGNPFDRFEEDRLRMVRAVRFGMRLCFTLESNTQKAIQELAHTLLPAVSMERIWQELCKIRKDVHFCQALLQMGQLGLLSIIFPPLKGTPQTTLHSRLEGVEKVSERVPTILVLCQLFSQEDLGFVIGLAMYLKASKEETKWIETFFEAKALWLRNPTLSSHYEWAYLLADHRSDACFEMLFTKLPEEEKAKATQVITRFSGEFAFHIDRIHKRKPLCRAKDLEPLGIRPGKKMGQILKVAEQLALTHNITQTEEVLTKLQEDPSWFKLLEDAHS